MYNTAPPLGTGTIVHLAIAIISRIGRIFGGG